MGAVSTFLAFALAEVSAGGIVRTDRVVLPSHDIRVTDVMSSPAGTIGARIVARIPAGRTSFAVSRAALAMLVRRAIPSLATGVSHTGSITFLVRPAAITARPVARCGLLVAPAAKGSVIDDTMVRRIACAKVKAARVAFDRANFGPIAGSDLAAGSYLGPLAVRRRSGLEKGEATTLIATVGPVRIVRDVTAMQSSRGRRVFVRDGDGQVFSVTQSELGK